MRNSLQDEESDGAGRYTSADKVESQKSKKQKSSCHTACLTNPDMAEPKESFMQSSPAPL